MKEEKGNQVQLSNHISHKDNLSYHLDNESNIYLRSASFKYSLSIICNLELIHLRSLQVQRKNKENSFEYRIIYCKQNIIPIILITAKVKYNLDLYTYVL